MINVLISQITGCKDVSKIICLLKKYQILIIPGVLEKEFFLYIGKNVFSWQIYLIFGNHALRHEPLTLPDGQKIKWYTIVHDWNTIKKMLMALGEVKFFKEVGV